MVTEPRKLVAGPSKMTHTQSVSELKHELSTFGSSAEGTSLYLLRQITETVDNLEALERLARQTSEHAELLTKIIAAHKPSVGKLLDPQDQAINAIESAYTMLEDALPKMLLKKQAIDQDDNLNDGHCDLLHASYDRCIDAFARFIESSKDLRAAVISHDLAAEPRGQLTFESVEDVIGDLRSPPVA